MGIYKIAQKIKGSSMKVQAINMASFGDIKLIENYKSVMYPFMNCDVVLSNTINNAAKLYTMRIYICDRNDSYIAYNKTELLMDELMVILKIDTYNINYFNFEYSDFNFSNKDGVNGVYVDIVFEDKITLKCVYEEVDDKSWIITENGDYLRSFITLENGGRTDQEDETNIE